MPNTWKQFIESQFESNGDTWDDVVYCSVPMECLESKWGEHTYLWEVVLKNRFNDETREITIEETKGSNVYASRKRIINTFKFLEEVVSLKNITEEYPYNGVAFRLWTEKFVYFPHGCDGYWDVQCVLRNPTEMNEGNTELFEGICL